MRQFIIGILCTAAVLSSGCSSKSNETSNAAGGQPPDGAMTVDPQKIVSAPGSIRTLHATFTIRPAKPNEPFVAPASVGGACLIAKIPVEGKSCTKQEQCNIAVPGQPDEWFGYCLDDNQLPATQGGTCWVKLSDSQNCLKPVGPGDHSTPAMNMSAAYDYVAQHSPNWRRPIDWVLLGCLNGPFDAPPPPCATNNGPHIYRASQVRPVP